MTKMTLQEYVAKRIRLLRLQKKMTQEELAEKANLGFNYIYRLENKRTNVKIETIDKIIAALEIDIVTFFDASFIEDTLEIAHLVENLRALPLDKMEKTIEALNLLIEQID